MPKVDKVQTIASKNFVNTTNVVEYFRSEETNGFVVSCVIRLSNGFEAVGRVSSTYESGITQAELEHLAFQQAINRAEQHGYELA